MASVEQRGEVFRARVRIKGMPLKTGTFDTEEEAWDWARKIEAAMTLGDPRVVEKPQIFETWIRRYIEEVADRWVTGDDKKSRLQHILELPIAQRKVASLTPADFEQLRDHLAKEGRRRGEGGLKPQTVRHYLQDCSAVWTQAKRKWRCTTLPNPLADVDIPPVSPGRKNRVREGLWKEIHAALGKHVNPFYQPFAEFLLETGMRVSEPLTVREWDVDWEGGVLIVIGKGSKQRAVPLSPRAMELLRAAREMRKTLPKVFSAPNGGSYDLSDYDDDLFWPISYSGFYRAWCDARKAAGDEKVWIHDLRRERANRRLDAGDDTTEVALALGHSSLRMLNEHYLVLSAQKLAKKLAQKVG